MGCQRGLLFVLKQPKALVVWRKNEKNFILCSLKQFFAHPSLNLSFESCQDRLLRVLLMDHSIAFYSDYS